MSAAARRDGEGGGERDPARSPRPEVKICGLTRRSDAEAAAGAGAAYLGLVFAESPRRVSPSRAGDLTDGLPARAVGVFVDAPADEVRRTAEAVPLDVVQLHGSESPQRCASLRGGGVRVWKALRPRSADELARGAERYGGAVDGLLVEGYSEAAAGGTGTGFPHAWWREAGLGDAAGGETALILAGGLTPENVQEALRAITPGVVDVSSGVEASPGVKDPGRVRAFVEAVRSASAAPRRGRDAARGGGDAGEPGDGEGGRG